VERRFTSLEGTVFRARAQIVQAAEHLVANRTGSHTAHRRTSL
jgi:hypothetical protein